MTKYSERTADSRQQGEDYGLKSMFLGLLASAFCLSSIPALAQQSGSKDKEARPLLKKTVPAVKALPEAVMVANRPNESLRRFSEGDAALRQGDMMAATRGYLSAAVANPHDAMTRLAAGVALADMGRNLDALAQFKRAVEFAEDDVIANLLLQNALAESGAASEAQTLNQDIYRRFGRPKGSGLDASTSVNRLTAALRRSPESPLFALLLGDAYQLSEQWDKADAAYRRALALAPNWSKPRVNLGLSRLAQGKTDDAIAQFEQALRRDPKNAQARLWKSDAELRAGKNAQAIRTLAPLMRVRNVGETAILAQAHANTGRAYANTRDFANATLNFNEAQKLAPTDPTPPALLGDIRLQYGEYGAAADSYSTALGLVRDGGLFARRPILYRSLAEAQLSARRPEQARQTLEQALKEEPQSATLWHRLNAQTYSAQGDKDKAREELKAALDAETGPYPLDTLRAADAQGAIAWLEEACQSDLTAAETGYRNTHSANGSIHIANIPKSEQTPELKIRALGLLAHIARYRNAPREEVGFRNKLLQVRAETKLSPNGWDYFLLAETYDQRLSEPLNARAAYAKSLEIGGLTPGAAQWARQRLGKLTAPSYKPK